MARLIPFNRTGIVGLETMGVSVAADSLTFTFQNHPYVNTPYNGLLLVKFTAKPTGITGTEPIYFETQGLLGSRKAVTKQGGVPLISSDISIPGYYMFFYDFNTGVVEAVGGVGNVA